MTEIDNELKKREILRMSNEESHKLTLECIRTALVYLMGTKPYEKITITEIIERSGVSRAAFYRNFSSKDEVLQSEMAEITRVLQKAFSNSLLTDNPRQWLVYFFDEVKHYRKEVELLLKADIDANQILNSISIEKNTQEPMFGYKVAIYLGSLWIIVKTWIKNDLKESPEELADFVRKIFVF